MTEDKENSNTFFDHFSKDDKTTKIGEWIVKAITGKVFSYTEAVSHSRILEIGPGRGVFADICLGKDIEYVAVEPNELMAASLERRGVTVFRAIVPPLPDVGKEYDAVVMNAVMEHMNSVQHALEITRQIKDVLKPGGKFIICSPDYLNWRQNFFNCDFSHNYVTTRRRLTQLLISSGFDKITSCYLSGPMTGWIAVVISIVAACLPFGYLNAMFPSNKILQKFYKIQLTFSRKVLIVGKKTG